MANLERRRSARERYPSLLLRAPTRPSLEFWGWGRNDFGQLGLGDETHQCRPTILENLENKDIVHFTGSSFNSGFLTDDGEVYMTGINDSGQLASKSFKTRFQPTRIVALDSYRITHFSIGVGHVLATTEQGLMLTWGLNDNGQLGHNFQTASPLPRPLHDLKNVIFVRVAAGSAHSLALTSSGLVYSAGQGTFGALGHGNEHHSSTFQKVKELFGHGIVQIDCGEFHSIALDSNGEVWAWGRGKHGQLGLGHTNNIFKPTLISSLLGIKQIACGDAHTLGLTRDGVVYSWGQSKWGQTGISSAEDCLLPTKISTLKDEFITQVSAGSRHSAVLALTGAIFVFGNHELGQLGQHLDSSFSPIPIQIKGCLPGYHVLSILASGDFNLVMYERTTSGNRLGMDNGRYGSGLLPFKVPNLLLLLDSIEKHQPAESEQELTFLRALDDIFECPGFLMNLFRNKNSPAELDVQLVTQTYERLFRSCYQKTVFQLGFACVRLLTQMIEVFQSTPPSPEDTKLALWFDSIVLIMLNPVFGEATAAGHEMVSKISVLIESFPSPLLLKFQPHVKDLPAELFGGRLLNGVQKYLTSITEHYSAVNNPIGGNQRNEVLRVCQLLSFLEKLNFEKNEPVSFEKFYNVGVSDGFELSHEFLIWASGTSPDPKAGTKAHSICEFPFVLTPEAKTRITHGEAMIRKHISVQRSQISALFHEIPPGLVSFLDIKIRRDHVREDAIHQLMRRTDELQKPLRVTFFSNGVPEEGQDEGGLSKEFFQLLIEEIFNVDFGMFVYNEETRDFWFRAEAFDVEDFRLVGMVLGLAIYNSVILDVHFPLVVYKKLLALTPDFQDLALAFPELAKGLQQLLEFDGDVETTYLRNFEIEYEFFGEMLTKELKPGGASIAVTNENRKEYVDLYTQYVLQDSIKDQFDVFNDGFWRVCGGKSLLLFRYEELELLICGLPHLDFHELQKVTRYDGGYNSSHRVIQDFWSVVHELSLKEKKKFLSFVTGCDRAPVGGLSKLQLIIQRSGPDTDRLPTSHTCFNILLLPEYNSREKLKERLSLAIHNAQGFGLQ